MIVLVVQNVAHEQDDRSVAKVLPPMRGFGLDIAKNVFQVHGIDAAEKVVVRKQLRRSQVLEFFKALPPCLVARGLRHSPLLGASTHEAWPPGSPDAGERREGLRKAQQNDAADAEAICEAVRRPTMRFVQVKSAEQQSQLMLQRTRDLLMPQRTQVRALVGRPPQRIYEFTLKLLLPVFAASLCHHIFQNASNAAISVLISFQIEQALQKESGPQFDIL